MSQIPLDPTTRLVRPLLVLGIGNILLSDEGVGVRVVEAMRETSLPDHVELCDGGTGGMDLVEMLAGRRKVVVVDAMQTDAPPGTVLRLTPEDLAGPAPGRLSVHEVSLLDALAMARQIGEPPGEVVILGVQPRQVDWGLELTPEIAALVPELIRRVQTELNA